MRPAIDMEALRRASADFWRNVESAFAAWKWPTGRNRALWRVTDGRQ